jgi:hypothetical protein
MCCRFARPAVTFLVLILLGGAAGCMRRHAEKDYVPAEGKARSALEAALSAWQNGQPFGQVEARSPSVKVQDFRWMRGQRLQGYEIVNTESVDGPTWFEVRLTFDDGKSEVARYVVLGIDPLNVFAEEDFKRVQGI